MRPGTGSLFLPKQTPGGLPETVKANLFLPKSRFSTKINPGGLPQTVTQSFYKTIPKSLLIIPQMALYEK